MEREIVLDGRSYKVVKNFKDGYNEEELLSKYTEYFQNFDYIFGDYSYDKLRLKGFYKKDHPNCRKINSIDGLETYIKDYCAYQCRYFLLEKK